MKAVQLHAYGGVDQLFYEDVPDPKPGAGEILVKVAATSLNPVDWKLRRGDLKDAMPLKLPAILGRDVAGTVVSLGSGTQGFQPGDRVMGLVNRAYAEFLVAKPEDLTHIPEGLNTEDAAALPLVVLTGSQLIEDGVQPNARSDCAGHGCSRQRRAHGRICRQATRDESNCRSEGQPAQRS